tara:strand:- start:2838 stop:3935 length:1098 start_codon:yes stop_codon:yes gene_type:complete
MKKFIIILTFFISCAQTDDTINIPTSINYTVTNIHQTEFVPWSIEFIDNDTFLYTERRGKMFIVSDGQSTEISNIPSVYQKNQGGLLDIELHPNFDQNNTLFFSFSKGNKEDGANTAVASAKLIDNSLQEVEILYVGKEMTNASLHFGSRLQFDDEGYLYFTIGDRGNRNKNPQDITRDAGKVYRINDDGSIPESNPFFNNQGARKAVFSYGHRNPQGMFKHPETGKIWTNEHGPRGGDEINIIEAGKNYGWPKITYGINYSGTTITNDKSLPGLEQPMYYWLPSIAPSGFAYLNSDIYDDWKGSLLVGSLKFMYLERLVIENNKVTYREKVAENIGRVRDVKVSPDGFIYLAVDNKGIFKLTPK